MKKAVGIFAVVAMSLGMFSSTTNSSSDDTPQYNIQSANACDTCDIPKDKRTPPPNN